jgi:GrpB-like predicted nucleotidyltransferase (UPF0157 family)
MATSAAVAENDHRLGFVDDARANRTFKQWLKRRRSAGASLIDLYELEADSRGIRADELTGADREQIWARALPVLYPGYEPLPNTARAAVEPIEIVPYDPAWPSLFKAWRESLVSVLGDLPIRIEHVGSTAVPNLPAKPVIDIQVSVADFREESRYVGAIESLGLQLRSRDNEHNYFRPFAGGPRAAHIHVCTHGSEWERRHLLFRDYLRSSERAREAYLASKKRAASRWPDDRLAYTEEKSAIISKLMEDAEAWVDESGWRGASTDASA